MVVPGPDPLPPVETAFFFKVLAKDQQPAPTPGHGKPILLCRIDIPQVYTQPDENSTCIGHRSHAEAPPSTWILLLLRAFLQVLRVVDFRGAWLRLAPDTEAQADENACFGSASFHFLDRLRKGRLGREDCDFRKCQLVVSETPDVSQGLLESYLVPATCYRSVHTPLILNVIQMFHVKGFMSNTVAPVSVVLSRWEGWMLAETAEDT